ncbi:MAG: NADH-quinone oxidoreductase subunit N [Thermoleophilia bacterium]|nr:NADH-quinone oxidoreductase subunit N [Thermoleophilia bacterium]
MTHDLLAIMPELMLIVTAVVVLLVDPLLPEEGRRGLSWLGIFACITAALSTWFARGEEFTAFSNSIALDKYSVFFKILLLGVAALAMLISEKHLHKKQRLLGDYYALILFTTVGMIVMAEAIDLITFFVGLELMALSSYLLAGFFRYEERSIEAAMKYFLTGAFASNILLFGMAFLYGLTGSTNYRDISEAIRLGPVPEGPLVIAIVLVLAGFAFKVSAAPFHNWAPDVYQGSPTPAAAFLSVGPKVAGFAAILKFFTMILGSQSEIWVPLMMALSVATMVVGSTMALVQKDLKRMLAFSSIGHVGYLLLAVVATGDSGSNVGMSAILFYLAAYAFMNMGAFAVLVHLSNNSENFRDSLDEIAGLGKRFPWAAGVMALFMLSLTGVPPTAGFLAKFYLFSAVVDAGFAWLAVVGALFSLVSAFFYLRVIVYMYMREPEESVSEKVDGRSWDLSLGIGLAAAGVVLLGILPAPVLNAAQDAVQKLLGN